MKDEDKDLNLIFKEGKTERFESESKGWECPTISTSWESLEKRDSSLQNELLIKLKSECMSSYSVTTKSVHRWAEGDLSTHL